MGRPPKNYNPRSRENLKQYKSVLDKKRTSKITKEIASEVKISEELLETIIPKKDVFKSNEQERFTLYLKAYIKEYGTKGAELTISDLDDISQLCKNKILEDRLLKEAKTTDIGVADVMAAIDRLKKDNVKLKEQLASTRRDRVDPKAGQMVTVMDLLEEYSRGTRESLEKKMEKYSLEEEEFEERIKSDIEDVIN